MEEKKYKLTDETIEVNGRTLYRIEATKDFGNVKVGDKGGFIDKDDNLSHSGNAWVYGNAKVYGDAWVYGDAEVYGNAKVYGDAWVSGDAWVYGDAKVSGNAWVYGNAKVSGDAWVYGDAKVSGNAEVYDNAKVSKLEDYIVFKNWWSSGRHFTWTRSNNKWRVGCFFGTGEELIAKAYKDSEKSGREYERVVRFVESILKDNQ